MARKIGHLALAGLFFAFLIIGFSSFFDELDGSLGATSMSGKFEDYGFIEEEYKVFEETHDEMVNPDDPMPEEDSEYIDDSGRDVSTYTSIKTKDILLDFTQHLQSDENFGIPSFYWWIATALIYTYLGILVLRSLIGESKQ